MSDGKILVMVVVCGLSYYNGHSLHVEHMRKHAEEEGKLHRFTVQPGETGEHHKPPMPVKPLPARPHARIRRKAT